MLRADNIICGTSTTGTGTLTLAATPTPPGGVDFDVWARTTGVGFGNSSVFMVSYTIIEYTTNSFTTAKAYEKGVGTVTLGGSSGIANVTLARTTVQSTGTSLNSQPATTTYSSPTAITIGTAANTLVFIGASGIETLCASPYIDLTASGGDGLGCMAINAPSGNQTSSATLSDSTDYYWPFMWAVPMLVKRFTLNCTVAYSGGTPVSNAWARIYDVDTTGKPGRLLYDFGLLGTSNASLNSTGTVSSGASGNGFFLMPGEYFIDLFVTLSGGTTPPKYGVTNTGGGLLLSGARNSIFNVAPLCMFSATGGSSTAPATAAVTGYSQFNGTNSPYFWLKAS